jgi:hypothetical protein
MYVAYNGETTPLKNYFNYYLNSLKMGLITSITGGGFIKTGTGKSYTAMKIAQDMDSTFDMEKVVYYPREFLTVMDRVEEDKRAGQVVVIDEGEIMAPASMYFSFTNKAIAYNLATFRYLRAMAIFVTPSFSWLDKRIRTLVSHWGYTEKHYTTGGKTTVDLRMYALKTNLFGDKTWINKLKLYNRKTGLIDVFKKFTVGLPSPELCEAYEKKSLEYKQLMRRELLKEVDKWVKWQGSESKETQEEKNIGEIIQKIADDETIMTSILSSRGNRIDMDLLKGKFQGLTTREAKQIKKIFEMSWSGRT